MALSANPTAWWKMEEASGTRADATGNGHTLTSVNSVVSTSGKIGNAAAFTAASSQTLTAVDAADIRVSGDLTVCAWVNYSNNAAQQTLLHKGISTNVTNYEYYWFIDSGNALRFRVSNGASLFQGVSASIGASPGWTFVAARYNSSTKAVSVRVNSTNGATVGTLTGTPNAGTRGLVVGAEASGSSYLNSPLDMLGIFQAYLSDADLTTIYNGGAALDYPFATGAFRRIGMAAGMSQLTGGITG